MVFCSLFNTQSFDSWFVIAPLKFKAEFEIDTAAASVIEGFVSIFAIVES